MISRASSMDRPIEIAASTQYSSLNIKPVFEKQTAPIGSKTVSSGLLLSVPRTRRRGVRRRSCAGPLEGDRVHSKRSRAFSSSVISSFVTIPNPPLATRFARIPGPVVLRAAEKLNVGTCESRVLFNGFDPHSGADAPGGAATALTLPASCYMCRASLHGTPEHTKQRDPFHGARPYFLAI